MVWDPKNTIGHNDYGSFERQSSSNNPEDDQQLRGCGALPLSPLHSQQATSSSMSDTDLIQRQPLLPLPAKVGTNHLCFVLPILFFTASMMVVISYVYNISAPVKNCLCGMSHMSYHPLFHFNSFFSEWTS